MSKMKMNEVGNMHMGTEGMDAGVTQERRDEGEYVFRRLALREQLPVVTRDNWPTASEAGEELLTLGVPLFEAWSKNRMRLEAILEIDGIVLLANLSMATEKIYLSIASRHADAERVAALLARIRELFPEREPNDEVKVTFWYQSEGFSSHHSRMIEAPRWSQIEANYPAATRGPLDRLMHATDAPVRGQLLLWHGEPGTGKTWALRALGREWSSWCDVEYVTDPEHFFGNADYMMKVLVEGVDGSAPHRLKDRWRLLILEDTGEMLAADAKSREGQRLSRLLNVVDGFIGQGLKLIILVTTNEELRSMHPAVSRPGRCAGVLEFGSFTHAEAEEWLFARGFAPDSARGPLALADLYAATDGGFERVRARPVGFATN